MEMISHAEETRLECSDEGRQAVIRKIAHQAAETLRWNATDGISLCRNILSECNLHTLGDEFGRIVTRLEKEAEAEENPFVT